MKLYLWENVLTDYTDGVMFALANSVEEARELIKQSTDWWSDTYHGVDLAKEPKVIDYPFGFSLSGGG